MNMRSLDANHDWNLGQGVQSYNYDQDAVAENIQTRLLSFLNDCFFDMGAGIDWLRLLGSKGTLQEIILTVRAVILGSYGVVRINSIVPTQDPSTRALQVTYNVDTIFTRNFSQTVQVP